MKRNMDSLLKELISEKYDSIKCPPKEEIWSELESRLLQESEKPAIKGYGTIMKVKIQFKLILYYISAKMKFLIFLLIRKRERRNE